jgi:BirA family transcriptional regulator, biotin operon repressor / biotin---[acetyl-CoA-carboxylase] ligase
LHTIENTLFLGRHLTHLASTDSTNRYAHQLLSKSKPPEGTVISAYEQMKGRGQIGSLWESERGKNLTFSVILYPSFLPLATQFALTQCLSLSILDALAPFIPEALSIKWPNDIYIGQRKVGGMLVQNSINQTQLQHSVVGIGINVNQTVFVSDAPNPISLKQITEKETDLFALLNSICTCMEKRYLQLRGGDFETIRKNYLENLYQFMEDHLYKDAKGKLFKGRIVNVLPDGKLLLMHDKGEQAFDMKEIQFIHA